MLIRRSNLIVDVADGNAVENSWRHGADAITLDVTSAPSKSAIVQAVAIASRGGAEVFVKASPGDLEALLVDGIAGFVLPRVQSAEDIARVEAEIGSNSTLEFIVLIETARAVWDIRSILRASSRITQAALVERALADDLGIAPDPSIDPFEYARGRLAVESTAAKVGAVGMSYPMSVLEIPNASQDEIHDAAVKARNSGMKGVLCRHAAWVAPVNAAFTPTPELVHYNRRVREAFAAGIAKGTAAVPLDGRMIDVPVDEWAIVVLAMADACAARDQAKRSALERAR